MYHNPRARTFTTSSPIDPAVLTFHRTLPSYSRTPLLRLPPLPHLSLNHVFLKDESARFSLPAFKILGASWASYRALTKRLDIPATSSLEDVKHAAQGQGVTLHAATDGNFGRAIARMAGLLGVRARIYVPEIMVSKTKALIVGEGAEVVVGNGDYDAAVRAAENGAKGQGGLLVQDDAWEGYEEIPQWVVDGYSTMMSEIDEQVQKELGRGVDLLVVPVGTGSLAQAVLCYYKKKGRETFVLTVEPDTAACLKTSLESGERTTIETGDTAMCGINCGTVSYLAWPYLRDGVDASVAVTEGEGKAALDMLTEMQIKTGPCSAGSLAALVKACQEGREQVGLHEDSIVVLLGTEGPR